MTALISLHPAPVEMLPGLVEAMSSADRTELAVLSKGAPVEILEEALSHAIFSWCWTLDGEPAAIGGLGSSGFIWMVASTPRLEHSKKSFLRLSQDEMQSVRLAAQGHNIISAVDQRWRKSIRWLKWLGFCETGQVTYYGARTATVLEYRA